MKIAIIGLGLIGGSLAKAFKAYTDNRVYGCDADAATLAYAKLSETVDEPLTDEILPECDLVIVALYPNATIRVLSEKAPLIKKGALVIDTCGTKRKVCAACFALAETYGFTFVGGHPMAGIQFSGIKYSRADLFKGASMILVPPHLDDMAFLTGMKTLFLPLGFSKVVLTTPEKHDEIIAFTSQLAHIVSSAYIKSDTAKLHHGFSAGSYKDMTRVATLNDTMWTELFLENRDNLLHEIDNIVSALTDFRAALAADDGEKLSALLREGTQDKSRIDG
ncbi:MAG: prephenate dehydrogenase [Eubacteriales bacterium]|jgi:prephenate dehydrogenase